MRSKLALTLGTALGCLLVVGGLAYTFLEERTVGSAAEATDVTSVPSLVLPPAGQPTVPPLVLPPAGQPAPDVEWDRLPDLGNDLPGSFLVYRLLRGPTGPERLKELATAFSVAAEPPSTELSDGTTCAAVAETNSVSVDSDGRVAYTSDDRVRTDADGTEPCTDEEAAALATDFLTRNGFLPEGSGFALSGVGVLGSFAGTRDGVPYRNDYGKLVSFHRTVDGLPVLGLSRLSVGIDRVDGQLQVVSLISAWHGIEPYAKLPLRGVEEAYTDLVAGKADADMTMGGTAVVESVSLAYYEPPLIYEQPFMQPVYVFEGTVSSGDQKASFSVLVPALAGSATAAVTQTPAAPAAPAIVPTGPIESARVRRDGQWSDISQPGAQAIMAAAAQALDFAPDAIAATPGRTGGLRAAERLERWRLATVWVKGVADIVFSQPLDFGLALPTPPTGLSGAPTLDVLTRNRLPLDDAGRTHVIAQRLMITVEAEGLDILHFAFLPRPGEDGQSLEFQLQWPNDHDNPTLVAVRQAIMGAAATTE